MSFVQLFGLVSAPMHDHYKVDGLDFFPPKPGKPELLANGLLVFLHMP